MKKSILKKLSMLFLVFSFSTVSQAVVYGNKVYVNGYYKSNGTYVQPYTRSLPNSNSNYYYNY